MNISYPLRNEIFIRLVVGSNFTAPLCVQRFIHVSYFMGFVQN